MKPKIQDCGYSAKSQISHTPLSRNLLKISKLANAQTIDIFYVPFIDFINDTYSAVRTLSPIPVKSQQKHSKINT
ncbi:hypothetical protein [Capnocytophaga canimorsus]|uniref:hypothetical protein n=1 Tax=Capnocytophaga canimorsus TaxID=28188 RepID=UPI0009D9E003